MSERPGVNRLLILEERPASEVAETLGLSVNAVLVAKSRVLRRLRQEGQGLIGYGAGRARCIFATSTSP
jgi:hypothetical protein